jgi:hypothetical protein
MKLRLAQWLQRLCRPTFPFCAQAESGFLNTSKQITCNIYVVVFETSNLKLSIPLVLFDLATALPAITLPP